MKRKHIKASLGEASESHKSGEERSGVGHSQSGSERAEMAVAG